MLPQKFETQLVSEDLECNLYGRVIGNNEKIVNVYRKLVACYLDSQNK